MPITSLFSSIGKLISYGLSLFSDNFNRTTSGSLGTSSSGTPWIPTSGVWSADGSQATTATAATSYPIASVDMGSSSSTVSLDVNGLGPGAAFWVVDANNWWGVTPYQATNTIYYSGCNDLYGAYTYLVTGQYNYTTSYQYSYCAAGQFVTTQYGIYSFCITTGFNTGYQPATGTYSYYSPGTYFISCGGGYYSGTYTTSGSVYLRLTKAVAGAISVVVDQLIPSAIASIKVIISNGVITARAYSGAGQTTQIGSDLVNTPSSPTTAVKTGIILAPGGYSQGNTLDNVTITVP